MQIYKTEVNPEAFKKIDLKSFLQDPLAAGSNQTESEKNSAKIFKYEMNTKYESIRRQGDDLGVDTKMIEYDIRKEIEEQENKGKDRMNNNINTQFCDSILVNHITDDARGTVVTGSVLVSAQ